MAHQAVTDLAKWREQQFEEMGGDGLPFVLPKVDEYGQPLVSSLGGEQETETFFVPHPLSLSDERSEKFEAAVGNVSSAKALLNTDDDPKVYARFVAAGGQPGDVMLAYRLMAKEMNAQKS